MVLVRNQDKLTMSKARTQGQTYAKDAINAAHKMFRDLQWQQDFITPSGKEAAKAQDSTKLRDRTKPGIATRLPMQFDKDPKRNAVSELQPRLGAWFMRAKKVTGFLDI